MTPMVFLLPSLLVGCAPVVEAPTELNELMGFLFEHAADDDDATLAAGAVNLDTWLIDGMDETADGYAVNDLSVESLSAVGYDDVDMDLLAGAAVGHTSVHVPEDLVSTAVEVDAPDIYGGSYDSYVRTYDGNERDFVKKKLDFIDSDVDQVATYAAVISVHSHSDVQYRWVETDLGWVMIERTWLLEAAEITPDDLVDLQGQFFIWAVIPSEDGTARTIQCTWVLATLLDSGFDSDIALNLMISSMSDAQETLDDYVTDNGAP